jgi:hypothetical protein
MQNSKIYKQIISPTEIYKAIYSLESYIFEKHLLNDSDYQDFMLLQDKYNEKFIAVFTLKCIKRIEAIINSDALFESSVFFRPKKYDEKVGNVEFRPLHSASLTDQVCMVVLLSALMFDDSSGKRKLSAISRLLPANFYGNIPSLKVTELFKPWNKQYKDYSADTIDANKQFLDNKKFKSELTLDLERFFPSINPAFIYNFILSKWSINTLSNDVECLKIILVKLLYFNVNIPFPLKKHYYPSSIKSKNLEYNIGIAQGLPQAYFFGNICMSVVASEIKQQFKGESFFYVDDSVVFTNKNVNQVVIDLLVEDINDDIEEYIQLPNIKDASLSQHMQHTKNAYRLNIHPLGKKSGFNSIRPIDSLSLLSAPASTFQNEIRTSQDEFEDIGLLRKAEALLSAVDKLIANSKDNQTELKRLNRFRKFYRNRVNLLKHAQSLDDIIDEKNIDSFISQYGLQTQPKDSEFFVLLDSDVFLFESQLKAEQLSTDKLLFDKFIKSINQFEYSCLNVPKPKTLKDNLYLNQVLTSIFNHPVLRNHKYETLEYSKELRGIRYRNNLTNVQKVDSISKIIENSRLENDK